MSSDQNDAILSEALISFVLIRYQKSFAKFHRNKAEKFE